MSIWEYLFSACKHHPYRCALMVMFFIGAAGAIYWSRLEPDALNFQQELLAGNYKELQHQLADIQRGYLAGKYNDQRVYYAFNAFDSTSPAIGRHLRQWVSKMPNSALAHAALGRYQEHMGWISRGANYADKTSAAQFSDMNAHFKSAASQFNKAIELSHKLSIAYAGLFDMATAYPAPDLRLLLRAALKQCPQSFEIRYQYIYGLQPLWGGSIAKIRSFPGTAEGKINNEWASAVLHGFADYAIAQQLVLRKQYLEAERHYTDALASAKFALYYIARGDVRSDMKHYKAAVSDYSKALQLEPLDTWALEGRGYAYSDLGKLRKARSDLNLALRLDPMNPEILEASADLYDKTGKLGAALKDYKNVVLYDPGDAYTYAMSGFIEFKQARYMAASRDYWIATTLEPNNAGYWSEFANVLYKRRQCEIRYVLVRLQKVCINNTVYPCTADRLRWAARMLDFVKSNPACARVTDNTPPELKKAGDSQ